MQTAGEAGDEMRNYGNTPIYRQAETVPFKVLAKRIGSDRHEESRYIFWPSDIIDRFFGKATNRRIIATRRLNII